MHDFGGELSMWFPGYCILGIGLLLWGEDPVTQDELKDEGKGWR